MHRNGLCLIAMIAVAISSAVPSRGLAQNVFNVFRLFKQVEADPGKSYTLSKEQGPWMIMAATFAAGRSTKLGESQRMRREAVEQAQELVHELRKRFKLQAYAYVRKFDHNDGTVRGRGIDRYGRPLRMRYQHDSKTREIAVMVGNYPAVDSPEAERDLKLIKDIEPAALMLPELAKAGRRTYQQLVGWRLSQKSISREQFMNYNSKQLQQSHNGLQINSAMRQHGPMGSAFISRNPLLPKDDFQGGVIDKVVYDMNKHVRYSLLDCPGKITVRVATFKGATIMDQKKIRQLQQGETKLKSRLGEAALRAHRLTEALRLKGYEAYEFHDRYTSIVTVGSFDSPGAPRPDGKIEINPKMHKVMKAFSPKPGGNPLSLLTIPFDIQPTPVATPRRSISADYARGGLFGWR